MPGFLSFLTLSGIRVFLNDAFFLYQSYTNRQVFTAVGVILIALILNIYVRRMVIAILKKITGVKHAAGDEETASSDEESKDVKPVSLPSLPVSSNMKQLMEALRAPVAFFIYLIAIYIALSVLNLTGTHPALPILLYSLITLDVTWFFFKLLDYLTEFLVKKYSLISDQKVVTSMFPIINKVIKFFLLVISSILIIQNLGYSVSSLLAGLGIGGLAVALAAKDTLANIFGSVMIFLDRPFMIGDWIVVKDVEGVVEDVGFRTTRIRTFTRTEVSLPNNIVSNEIIQNFSRRPMQRVRVTLSLTYSTPTGKILTAIERIREIIENHPDTDKESYAVYFSEFGDSHLGILMNFFINSTDFTVFLQARQEIFLAIKETFEELGIDFAFPSRSLYIETPIPGLKDSGISAHQSQVMPDVPVELRETKSPLLTSQEK